MPNRAETRSLSLRLLAVPPAFAAACLVGPLPTLAVFAAGSGAWGPMANAMLFLLPVLSLFTAIFSVPFALPIMLWLAATDRRGVGLQVVLGMLAAIPATIWFDAVMEDIDAVIAGAVLGGGALAGLTASAVRDRAEHGLRGSRSDPRPSSFGPPAPRPHSLPSRPLPPRSLPSRPLPSRPQTL